MRVLEVSLKKLTELSSGKLQGRITLSMHTQNLLWPLGRWLLAKQL